MASVAVEKDFNAKFAEENPRSSQRKNSSVRPQHKLGHYQYETAFDKEKR
jgi:hypothetical protein